MSFVLSVSCKRLILSVIMLNVVMLNVIAPKYSLKLSSQNDHQGKTLMLKQHF